MRKTKNTRKVRGGRRRVIYTQSGTGKGRVRNIMYLDDEAQYTDMVQGPNKINEDNIHFFVRNNPLLQRGLDTDVPPEIIEIADDGDIIIATYHKSNVDPDSHTPSRSRSPSRKSPSRSRSSSRSKSPSRRGGSKKRRKSMKQKQI